MQKPDLHMIRTTIISILLLLIIHTGHSQDSVIRLDSFSRVYADALKQENFDVLITLTHPDVVSIAGGIEYARQDLVRDANEYNRMKLRLTSVETKTSSKIIKAGEELHAIVPYEKLYENEGLKHEEKNYYLAASVDNGQTWTFLDLRKHDIESIPLFIPAYDGRLNIFLEE